MKGMRDKKRKCLLLLSVLLCITMVLPVNSTIAEESQEPGSTEFFEQFDTTSWKSTPWAVSDTCTSGGSHELYSEEDSHIVLPGPFGYTVRAGKYTYEFEATCEYGDGTVTLGCCKKCKAWVIVDTTVQNGAGKVHVWSDTITEEATCTEQGRTYKKCEDCGILGDLQMLPMKEHTPGEWEVKTVGQCSNLGNNVLGEEVQKCTVCGTVLKHRYTQPEHVFGDWKITRQPQLMVEGEKERVCTICGRKETEAIPALEAPPEHEHVFVADSEHCGMDKCTVCGVMRQNDKNHVITEWIPNGPLTENGEHLGVCSVCGKTVTEAHLYEDDNDCTTDVVCSVCGLVVKEGMEEHFKFPLFDEDLHPYYRYVDNGDGTHSRLCSNLGCEQPVEAGKPHEFNSDGICIECGLESKPDDDQGCGGKAHQWSEVITEEATCTKEGRTYQRCEVCGILKNVVIYPREEHVLSQWQLVKQASCSPDGDIFGREIKICTICNTVVEQRDIKPVHDFGEWIITKEAKPGVAGEKERVCTICGRKETETIPALEVPPDHQHEFVADPDHCDRDICNGCGQTRPNGKQHVVTEWRMDTELPGKHIGICDICGDTVTGDHSCVDDGDCTTDVICSICGLVVVKGSDGHNKYPQFDAQNNPYYTGVDNGNGTHTRLCSNRGCTKTTGVIETHEYDTDGFCTVCGAKATAGTNSQSSALGSEGANAGMSASGSKLPVNVELPAGTDPSLTLTIKNVTVTDKEVKATVSEKYTEYVAYDITLTKENGTVVQPNGTVKVSIPLPAGWENVDVYHVDGDQMEKMQTVVENGYAVFTTTHFSVYVLVKNDSSVASAAAAEPTKSQTNQEVLSSPKTGDVASGRLMICIVLLLSSAVGMCIFFGGKSRKIR